VTAGPQALLNLDLEDAAGNTMLRNEAAAPAASDKDGALQNVTNDLARMHTDIAWRNEKGDMRAVQSSLQNVGSRV